MIWLHIPIVLNVHGVNDVRQVEIHAAEPQVPELSVCDVMMAMPNAKAMFFNSAPK